MAQFELPAEVWIHVFGHLTAADKSSVRAACKHFKKLVDHGPLWRNWAVVLDFQRGPYNHKFWVTLRRRRVTSAVVRSSKAKDWRQLAVSLPALNTLVMEHSSQESLDSLKNFTQLKRLAIRSGSSPLVIKPSTVSHLQQLTHLSLCGVQVPTDIFIVSQFTNLTSLVCHQKINQRDSLQMFHSIITCQPKLKHLSWSMNRVSDVCDGHSHPRLGPPGGSALSSLELVDYLDPLLSKDAMKLLLPGLQSLAIFYKHSHHQIHLTQHDVCHLKTWLGDLHHLSTLVIFRGPPVHEYANSIPATVTSLTLSHVGPISLKELETVATRVPNLLHLHVDLWPSFLGAHTGEIPRLFPKLTSLKLRFQHVPEKDFLHLRQLQNLKYLQVLDGQRPHLSELTSKLQALTNYRVQVTIFPHHRDLLACPCVYVY